MIEILNSPFANNLALALFHSIWQAGLVYLLIKFFDSFFNKVSSNFKYGLALGSLGIFILVNFFTFGTLISEGITGTVGITSVWNKAQLGEVTPAITSNLGEFNMVSTIPYFILFWWFGLVFFTVRLGVNLYRTHQLSSIGLISPSTRIQAIFDTTISRLRMSKKIEMYLSEKVFSPAVIGVIKPIVLLPIGLINGLSTEDVEAILIHELNHIRRHDYLVNLVQSLIEVMYFFNPFVWLISREIREQRENVCDDKAISMGVSRQSYAETLANIYEYAYYQSNLAISFAEKEKLTLKRIRRIMNSQTSNNKLFASLFLVTAISLAIYIGADKSVGNDNYLSSTPERVVMASPIGSFTELNPTNLIEKLDQSLDKKILAENTKVELDTIDEKELEQKVKEYEKAVDRLQASKEWQELESLRKEMLDEQMELMKELSPQIEEAMREVDMSVKMEALELAELKEKMAEVQIEMGAMEFSEEIERAMEQSARMIEESMAQVEAEMERISSTELESMAREYAVISEKYAHEAEKMAREAEEVMLEAQEVAEKAETFIKELKSELIKDGYINKKDDLDDLRFEDGNVYINDKAVKTKDAKKYYELKSKYLGKDSEYFTN